MENELFEKTKVSKAYMTLALPVVLGMVVSLIYNMVDTFFIARTGNTALIAMIKRITCTFFYLRHKTFCFIICQRFKNASLPLILFSISE